MEARMALSHYEQSYRARALKLFPWICAHCGREFDGKKLSQLTVHHKDHNHDNNPPDGSNWELLCLYCHDNEHQRDQVGGGANEPSPNHEPDHPFTPFANLAGLLKRNTAA
ncbi:MAG: YajD family HNH nuclease [Nitrospiraceae bacterium]|jgi:5-methylcytosine-specific restriction endonuclease McrA|uniref:YajD family HNH nuclease n=1 Tax=Nitrospira cf. moscoviensis SBR1015 TaxID=96242 RepID=UPI000A0D882C|nr:YajD family HNH nuclease [Nitrospira cf. moscoviensis SBR1015]MBY0248816.1 YajD family HNH nuclease [Nitrospiraceae bacterium]OQW31256.1 MAG: HNH endonuclease [Nitrospira sp. SG-bin2]